MVNTEKLVKLAEAEMRRGGPAAYKQRIRSLFGLKRGRFNEARLDVNDREFSPEEISIQQLAYDFLGRNYQDRLQEVQFANSRIREAGGDTVLPSTFININGFTATVTGLLEAAMLDGYQSPEFIGESMTRLEPTRVNGGKAIGITMVGGEDEALKHGEPYPTVGLKEDWISIPENERRGRSLQLDEATVIYDRTGDALNAARQVGFATQMTKERRIARVVQGTQNPYSRQDAASNTYKAVAGTAPNQYVNESNITLENHTDVDEAIQIIEANVDPSTGFEITLAKGMGVMLVAPQREMLASTILRATSIEQRTASAAEIRIGPNPVAPYKLVSSRIWYNQLIADGGFSANEAVATWFLMDPTRAFAYRQVIPFQTREAPLGADEMKADIILVVVAREWGVPYVREPRYAFRSTSFSP